MKVAADSPAALARTLVTAELARPGLVLDTATPRSALAVLRALPPRLTAGLERADVDVALDYLAGRGLASRTREEWEVSPSRSQGYRWSRFATEDALKRFVDGGVKKCAWRKCRAVLEGGQPHGRFCSNRCANHHHHDIHGIHGTVR